MTELRDTWQGRVLATARGRMAMVVPSILAYHESDLTMLNLMVAVNPPCWDMMRMSLRTPFLCSVAKIDRFGQVVADVIEREVRSGPMRRRNAILFVNLSDFRTELCRLADLCLRLSDADRAAFFSASVKWVAADMRLDPTMDPRDPDARRMTSPGVKPAHPIVH
jgi:hypothetical protein